MLRKTGLLSVLLIVGLCAGAWAELISYHPFDEGSGTTSADATGNGHDGALEGSVEWVSGVKGTAVRLDTAGERVVIGEIDPTAANNAMTLAAWINWEGRDHTITHQGIFGKRQGWDPKTFVKWFWEVQPDGDLEFRNGDTAVNAPGVLDPYENEWAHVAVTWDNGAVVQYINAEQVGTGSITFRDTADATVVSIGCVSATNSETFVGSIDEARIYDTALTPAEIDRAMTGDTASAGAPQPATGATDVRTDVILSWMAGEFAASHDVYFGMDFDDVSEASSTDGRGVLVSPGQIATSYAPDEPLELGQIYYWRVDEVNAPPDSSVAKGQVWSFTVEPYAYPLANVTATAGSSATQQGMTPDKTVDGSGMNAADEHSTEDTAAWLTGPEAGLPAWIQYEFSQVYKLHELWVWNSNQTVESFIGFGAKDVTVEYSLDGVEWSTLGDVEFAQAPGEPGYGDYTTVDMEGVQARFVRLTITSNWSQFSQQTGLSEVRFFYAPLRAREPQPTVGAEGVGLDAALSWRTGRGSASHEVYVSSDRAAIADGTAPVTTTETPSYDLRDANPQYGRTVYWKVNELDGGGALIAEGDIWSFSTTEYLVVDDFESYTDDIEAAETIWQTWSDGLENSQRGGSQVGYNEAPFAEQTIVYAGKQSMPVQYDNTTSPYYSEAARTWDAAQDWTVAGVDTLFMHFRGNPTLFLEGADGAITMSGAGEDIWDIADQFTFAHKSLSGDGSVVVRVDSLQNTDPWAKAGVMIRDSLDPGSKNAMAYVTADGRVGWQFREIIAGTSDSTRSEPAEITLPHWVRLTRTGNVIKAEHSSDGTNWQPMVEAANPGEPTEREIPMNSTVYVGLALTSHSEGVVNTAELSSAAAAGNEPWQVTQIGVDQLFNDRADLYVVLEDSGGRSKLVKHPDPDAVLQQNWQQWAISLADFADAGVRLSAIETIYIGVGDRTNPVADGAGRLYVDEIGVGHPGLQDPGASGLVAYYPLENSVEDASGNGHDGTVMGEPAYVDGPEGYGMALEFDGTGGQYVDLGTWDPSAAAGQLSVTLWAKWNGLNGQYQGLIGKRDSWDAADMMWDIEANRDTGILRFGRNGSTVGSNNVVLPEGEWEHVTVTFDGAVLRFYVGGVMTNSAGNFSFGTDVDASLQFGCGGGGGGNAFNGALDEVRIYDRALSGFEIKYLAGE